MTKNELKYINFLKKENERLKTILICFMDALGKARSVADIEDISLIPIMSELNKQYRAEIKVEAYKEFDELLKDECLSYPLEENDITMLVDVKSYNNLLNELVGGADGKNN